MKLVLVRTKVPHWSKFVRKNCTDFSVNIFVYRLKNIKIKISLIQHTIDPDLDSAVLLFTFIRIQSVHFMTESLIQTCSKEVL